MKQHLMEWILGLCPEPEGRKSCLMMALKSARYHTGRDINTGKTGGSLEMRCNVNMRNEILENGMEDAEMFTGLTLYVILLEQIGTLFGNKEEPKAIKRILQTTGNKIPLGLNKEQTVAVNDLRNTLAHNFGLATEPRCNKKGTEVHHKFTLSFSDDAPPVRLPEQKWDGCFTDKQDCTSTEIGVPALCELVEEVIDYVRQSYKNGKLELRLGEEETEARFTIRV